MTYIYIYVFNYYLNICSNFKPKLYIELNMQLKIINNVVIIN
jgi:hypothetical protein